MIDIHCHLLPKIDDGPDDIETSLTMLRMSEEDGVTHVVATPHFRHGERPDIGDIGQAVDRLKKEAAGRGIKTELLAGADIRLTYELTEAVLAGRLPTINGSRYFLLELPELVPPHLESFLFEAEIKGFIPIITHPERNMTFLGNPDLALTLRDSGVLFQLTAMSITGGFGRQIEKFSQLLLKEHAVDFVASDAHSSSKRTPVLSEAFQKVRKMVDYKTAQTLFVENPLAVIENRDIF